MVLSSCSSCSCIPCPCEACKRRRMYAAPLGSENRKRDSDASQACEETCRQKLSLQQRQTSGQLKNLGVWNTVGRREVGQSTSLPSPSFNQSEPSVQGHSFGIDQKFKDYRPTTAQMRKFGEHNYDDDEDDNGEDVQLRLKQHTDASSSLGYFAKEVISTVTFFAVMTVCLWATLVSFGLRSVKKLMKTDRRVRIIGLGILTLIILILLYGFVSHGIKSMRRSRKSSVNAKNSFFSWGTKRPHNPAPNSRKKNCNPTQKGAKTSCAAQHDWQFWAEWHPGRTMTGWFASLCRLKDKLFTAPEHLRTDDEWAKEVMKQSKFYAIPMEMKMPPQILVYLRDTFFG